MRTNLDLITGRRNLEFDEGEFLLKGKGSNLNIERFNMDGPMVYLNVEKGYLNPFHRHFDLHTETSFSGVVLPIHLTGSLEQPTVDSSLFLQKFLNKNSKNLLSSTFKLLTLGMGERILEGENRTQTEVPEE